jgi:hypothetical protein
MADNLDGAVSEPSGHNGLFAGNDKKAGFLSGEKVPPARAMLARVLNPTTYSI